MAFRMPNKNKCQKATCKMTMSDGPKCNTNEHATSRITCLAARGVSKLSATRCVQAARRPPRPPTCDHACDPTHKHCKEAGSAAATCKQETRVHIMINHCTSKACIARLKKHDARQMPRKQSRRDYKCSATDMLHVLHDRDWCEYAVVCLQ